MEKEELKKQVKRMLEELGAQVVQFTEPDDGHMVVFFNWERVVSFKAALPGWNYTGIQLDTSRIGEYKIEFSKI